MWDLAFALAVVGCLCPPPLPLGLVLSHRMGTDGQGPAWRGGAWVSAGTAGAHLSRDIFGLLTGGWPGLAFLGCQT